MNESFSCRFEKAIIQKNHIEKWSSNVILNGENGKCESKSKQQRKTVRLNWGNVTFVRIKHSSTMVITTDMVHTTTQNRRRQYQCINR